MYHQVRPQLVLNHNFEMANSMLKSELCFVTYNLHGYNQGRNTLLDIIKDKSPSILMLQEHWLTPANLIKFNDDFPDYRAFGSSALEHRIECGPLVGRPYGGIMILVNNNYLHVCECLHVSERFAAVKVGNILFVTVYLPCVGTTDRLLICNEIFDNIMYWRSMHADCGCIIAGDFNSNLDVDCVISRYINKFLSDNHFNRSDLFSENRNKFTYVNEALNHSSKIDYIIYDNVCINHYDVMDPDINFSDHLPVVAHCTVIDDKHFKRGNCMSSSLNNAVVRLRWDRADLLSYYNHTHEVLKPIYAELLSINDGSVRYNDTNLLDSVYQKIVDALITCAEIDVPSHTKNFYKFWWSQELDCLKERSIDTNRLWKAAGRPRSGPVFDERCKAKREYRFAIRKNQYESTEAYTNELHEALLLKHGNEFWKCWNSKFENKSLRIPQVNGLVDSQQIADKFATHFAESCSNLTQSGSAHLADLYRSKRPKYVGAPFLDEYNFDAELVENIVADLKRGKAAGLDKITAEHLKHCHPLLPCILAKLFNWMMQTGHVPDEFGLSYTVPLLKSNTVTSCKKRRC